MIQIGDTFTNQVTGEQIRFVQTAATTNSQYVQFDNLVRARAAGPPLHIHAQQEEQFTVLSGILFVQVNGKHQTLGAGETAVIPANTPHTFDNRHGEDVLFRVTLTPALDSEHFFVGMIERANQRRKAIPSLHQLATLLQSIETEFYLVGSPRWLQRGLFRLLAYGARA